MTNFFKNIFIEEKEWVKENIYNKSLIEAKDQFNKKFNEMDVKNPSMEQQCENSRAKGKLMTSLVYRFDDKTKRLYIYFNIVKGFDFSYTLFKTYQDTGSDKAIFVEFGKFKELKLVYEEDFQNYLMEKIFGSERFSATISQLSILN